MSASGYWICGWCHTIWPRGHYADSVRHVNCPSCGKNGDRDGNIFYRQSYSEAQQLAKR